MVLDLTTCKSGQQIDDCLLVMRRERKLTKGGKPYGDLLLGNKTGALPAKIWELDEDTFKSIGAESVVRATGLIELFNEQPQIRLTRVALVDDAEVSFEDLLPCTPEDVEELQAELRALIESLSNPHLKRLMRQIFGDPERSASFSIAPAAKGFHHAYLGGLLEHTVGVARLCNLIAGNYPGRVNRDLLVSGALLHDIGKIREFSYRRTIDYSTEGRLIGHHVLGYELMRQAAAELEGIDQEVVLQLGHLILSHHGSYEHQSPRKPKTIEALLLHLCDDADAKVHAFLNIEERAGDGAEWSQYNRVLERFVYLNKLDGSEADGLDEPVEVDELSPIGVPGIEASVIE